MRKCLFIFLLISGNLYGVTARGPAVDSLIIDNKVSFSGDTIRYITIKNNHGRYGLFLEITSDSQDTGDYKLCLYHATNYTDTLVFLSAPVVYKNVGITGLPEGNFDVIITQADCFTSKISNLKFSGNMPGLVSGKQLLKINTVEENGESAYKEHEFMVTFKLGVSDYESKRIISGKKCGIIATAKENNHGDIYGFIPFDSTIISEMMEYSITTSEMTGYRSNPYETIPELIDSPDSLKDEYKNVYLLSTPYKVTPADIIDYFNNLTVVESAVCRNSKIYKRGNLGDDIYSPYKNLNKWPRGKNSELKKLVIITSVYAIVSIASFVVSAIGHRTCW